VLTAIYSIITFARVVIRSSSFLSIPRSESVDQFSTATNFFQHEVLLLRRRSSPHCLCLSVSLPEPPLPPHLLTLHSQYSQGPVATSIPGGCNPAHPGSCPDSYFSTTVSVPVATSIPGGCNPAHPGSCPTPSASSGDKCQDTYKSCVAAGTPEVACACDLQACVGEDNARGREYCASATASIKRSSTASTPAGTSIPGGCNPAHPGSCPTPSAVSVGYGASTPVASSIPGGCNPAHPGSCPTPAVGSGGSKPSYVASNGTTGHVNGTATSSGKLAEFTGAAGQNAVSAALVVLGAIAAYAL
jgi:hypothetical protein